MLIACAAEQKRDERVEGRSRLVGSSRDSLSQSRYCTPIVQLLLRLPSTPLSCDRARNAPVPPTPAGCIDMRTRHMYKMCTHVKMRGKVVKVS